jgi:transcriptional regulator with XRE-family HTH domain
MEVGFMPGIIATSSVIVNADASSPVDSPSRALYRPAVTTVAARVRSVLDRTGWSQRELSRRAGLASATIGWILGHPDRTTELDTIEKIARAAGVSSAWLATGRGSPDDRDDLEHPIGGLTIDWQGTEGWVWSRVARDEVLVTLRGVAEAHGVEIVEGEEQPAPIAKPKRAKKTARKGSLR